MDIWALVVQYWPIIAAALLPLLPRLFPNNPILVTILQKLLGKDAVRSAAGVQDGSENVAFWESVATLETQCDCAGSRKALSALVEAKLKAPANDPA